VTPTHPSILMVCGVDQPVSAWSEISSLVFSSAMSSTGMSSVTSLHMTLTGSLRLSSNNSCGLWHICPAVNLSLQLKQSPCARRLCISSYVSLFIGTEELDFGGGRVNGVQVDCFGRVNFPCRIICPPFILAKLIASFKVRGLNIRIALEISTLSSPINVPTNTF